MPETREPADVSRFHCAQGFEPARSKKQSAFCSLQTPLQQIQGLIDADPEARGKTVVADSFDEKTVRAGMAHLNAVRKQHGIKEIPGAEIDAFIRTVAECRAKEGDDPVTIPSGNGFWMSIAPKKASSGEWLAAGLVLPASDRFRKDLGAAFGTQGVILHEAGHAVSGRIGGERIADMTTALLRIARHEQGMEKTLAVTADWRTLQPGTRQSQGADDLLRLRHELMTDPGDLRRQLEGKTISQIVELATRKVADATIDPKTQKLAGSERGMNIAIALLYPKPEYAKDLKDLTHLDRDTAVTLLRTQMAIEAHTQPGKDNALSHAMPGLWKDNPQAFRDAQHYMKDSYGIDVSPPPAPAVEKKSRPAASPGM
jgi:hypothetical protein